MKPALIAHCRAGFEAEAAADLVEVAAAAGTSLDIDTAQGQAFVVAHPSYWDAARWARCLDTTPPVFVRSLFVGSGPHQLFDPATAKGRPDRVALLLPHIETLREMRTGTSLATPPADLFVETPDTNDGKELTGLCRAIAEPLADALRERGWLAGENRELGFAAPAQPQASRLHVLFADGAHAYVGTSATTWGSAWPMGIPRLKMPHGAPSRSAMKLAEAFLVFLGDRADTLLRPAMHAVDLGAAPGGWTWQLAHRGLKVVAVDNGPLKGEVAEDPLVTHLRTDGLSYHPRRPVDWLVCDIADQPARIASLIARWMAHGDARRAIFNLKLPMKKRWDEVQRCRDIIDETLGRAGVRYTLALRQLYHDREEITGYCTIDHSLLKPPGGPKPSAGKSPSRSTKPAHSRKPAHFPKPGSASKSPNSRKSRGSAKSPGATKSTGTAKSPSRGNKPRSRGNRQSGTMPRR
mgnify:CR=1 FL=1